MPGDGMLPHQREVRPSLRGMLGMNRKRSPEAPAQRPRLSLEPSKSVPGAAAARMMKRKSIFLHHTHLSASTRNMLKRSARYGSDRSTESSSFGIFDFSDEAREGFARITGVIMPFERKRLQWGMIMYVVERYIAIVIPVNAAFRCWDPERLPAWPIVLDVLLIVLLLIDIAVNLNTAFFSGSGKLVTNRKAIQRHYASEGVLYVDVVSALPIALICAGAMMNNDALARTYGPLRVTHMVRLLRWLRHDPFAVSFNTKLQSTRPVEYGQAMQFLRLLGRMFLIGHLLACIWWVELAATGQQEWSSPLGSAYLYAMYHSMLSIFGEDVEPQTNSATAIALFGLFLGGIVTAFLFGEIAHIISIQNAEEAGHREDLEKLARTMHQLDVPHDVRERVYQYFNYVWVRHRNFSVNAFLQRLPETLHREVAAHVHIKDIMRVPLFKDCHRFFLEDLSRRMHPCVFLTGSTIFAKGTLGRSMYFIRHGTVMIHGEEGGADILNMLNRGDFFGEIAVLTTVPRIAYATAITVCDLFELSKSDVDEVVELFPADAALLKAVAKKRLKRSINLAANRPSRQESQGKEQQSSRRHTGASVTSCSSAGSSHNEREGSLSRNAETYTLEEPSSPGIVVEPTLCRLVRAQKEAEDSTNNRWRCPADNRDTTISEASGEPSVGWRPSEERRSAEPCLAAGSDTVEVDTAATPHPPNGERPSSPWRSAPARPRQDSWTTEVAL